MNTALQRQRVEQIKSSVSIQSLFENDGHRLIKSSGLLKCCCPFHREKTPSCVIYSDHFHCFGCCSRGDVFDYVMRRDGCDFKAAMDRLDGNGLNHAVTWSAVRKPAKVKKEEYLKPEVLECFLNHCRMQTGYGLVDEFADSLRVSRDSFFHLGVTWSIRERAWVFPMVDHRRNVVGIRLRDNKGKKWALKGSRQGLFIPITSPGKDLYVTEGPTDCAALLSMGLFAIGKAAAMQGPEEIIKFIELHRIKRVIVIADNDSAGLKGAKKLIDVCPVPCCEIVLPAKDAREFYRNGGTRELIENLVKQAVWKNTRYAKMDK